jgi:hypothetical protein
VFSKTRKYVAVLALACAASMWFYVDHILVPFQQADAAAHSRPRGNLSDLYPRWLGARELLLHHRNPYSHEITRQIQAGYYGRPLDANRPGDPRDQQGFAYPVYVAFLLAPTIWFPFAKVALVFKWLLVLLAALSVVLWVRALGWKPEPSSWIAMMALTVGSFPVLQALHLQQLTLVVGTLIAVASALLVAGQLFWAGVVLAIATIKPQLVLPLAAYLALWAASDLRRRRDLLLGFVGVLGVLLAGSELLLPGWFWNFLAATEDYRRYTGGLSLLDVLLSPRLGGFATMLVLVSMLGAFWRFRNEQPGTPEFSVVLALALANTVVVIPMFALYNTFLLLPAVLVIVQNWQLLWSSGGLSRLGLILSAMAVAWPWMAALGLFFASMILSPAAIQQGWWLPLSSSVKLPIPLVCLVPLTFMIIWAWREHEVPLPARESSVA